MMNNYMTTLEEISYIVFSLKILQFCIKNSECKIF